MFGWVVDLFYWFPGLVSVSLVTGRWWTTCSAGMCTPTRAPLRTSASLGSVRATWWRRGSIHSKAGTRWTKMYFSTPFTQVIVKLVRPYFPVSRMLLLCSQDRLCFHSNASLWSLSEILRVGERDSQVLEDAARCESYCVSTFPCPSHRASTEWHPTSCPVHSVEELLAALLELCNLQFSVLDSEREAPWLTGCQFGCHVHQ